MIKLNMRKYIISLGGYRVVERVPAPDLRCPVRPEWYCYPLTTGRMYVRCVARCEHGCGRTFKEEEWAPAAPEGQMSLFALEAQ